MFNHEKFGGRSICNQRVTLFKECMDNYGMIDLGYSRPSFTWTNFQECPNLSQARLDIVYANVNWLSSYPYSLVMHLPKPHFDHYLVLLDLFQSETKFL